MTAMHAVEITDSHHRAAQWANIDGLRAIAHDVEGFCGLAGSIHGTIYGTIHEAIHGSISVLHVISVTVCSIWRHAAFLGVHTVTAPLTKFQINGLFKRRC